jgi:hypothetical protein
VVQRLVILRKRYCNHRRDAETDDNEQKQQPATE